MIRIAAILSGCIAGAAGVLAGQELLTQYELRGAGRANGMVVLHAQAVEQGPNADNLPPVGRSLFDHLISNGKGASQVPFPFERLIERIEREVQASSSGLPPVKQVLIPLGRSLQRNAGAPDFFKYPRVVAAVDGDPAHSSVMVLTDRLFLGYHEKAAIIEVVSYNEAAGRFEFQVVKDYRAGVTPRVFYANRTLCTSCHQNGAPVFSRPLWDETNANPEIAARLKTNAERFYGVAVDRGVDFPNAIDEATDRANRLSLYQRVWREGCGGGADGDRCRAGLFLLALQYALTGQRPADVGPLEAQAMATLVRNAQTTWPEGLPIADPDLPNRDPLRFQRAIHESNVASDADPLQPRPPLAIWSAARETDMRQLIAGLADFFTATDMRRLDHHLLSRAAQGRAIQRTYRAPCEVRRKPLGPPGHRLTFDCRGEGAALTAVVYVKGVSATGTVQRMKLDDAPELRDLALQSTAENRFSVLARGLTARRSDGNAIESITLSASESNAEARVNVIEDFPPVRAAIAEMARENDALSVQPFRRAALLKSLFARLGLESASWCCLDDAGMAPVELELVAERVANDSEPRATELEGFYRYCAVCHQSRERFPPGFLGGLPAEVSAALTRCAPRIYYRLRMWERERGQRAKTPMPPAQGLRAFGISIEAWRTNETFAELKRYADKRLPAGLNTDSIMQRPYESLPECAQ